jgi:hypothetical protein
MVRSKVTDGLGEGLCGRLHNLAKRQGKQILCVAMEMPNPSGSQQTFRDRIATRIIVAICHDLAEHSFTRHTVPDPVVEPVARTHIVLLAGDQIAEDMGPLVVGESEFPVKQLPRGTRHIIFRDQATPCEISGIGWSHGWPELLTSG